MNVKKIELKRKNRIFVQILTTNKMVLNTDNVPLGILYAAELNAKKGYYVNVESRSEHKRKVREWEFAWDDKLENLKKKRRREMYILQGEVYGKK